ncbi:MAG: hypothetical protein ACOVLI_02305, partial [Rhabdaerophilum sp.]
WPGDPHADFGQQFLDPAAEHRAALRLSRIEHFQAKWFPVRVKKMRSGKERCIFKRSMPLRKRGCEPVRATKMRSGKERAFSSTNRYPMDRKML